MFPAIFWCPGETTLWETTLSQRLDAETTILVKFAFWRGLGRGKIYGTLSENAVFILGNSMTIKFGNFANFIVRNFVVICQGAAKGGVIKGAVYKCKRTRANARKRRQTQISGSLKRDRKRR